MDKLTLSDGCQPKNRGGPPKWMVKIMENPIKMDDLGGFFPYFWVDTQMYTKSREISNTFEHNQVLILGRQQARQRYKHPAVRMSEPHTLL